MNDINPTNSESENSSITKNSPVDDFENIAKIWHDRAHLMAAGLGSLGVSSLVLRGIEFTTDNDIAPVAEVGLLSMATAVSMIHMHFINRKSPQG